MSDDPAERLREALSEKRQKADEEARQAAQTAEEYRKRLTANAEGLARVVRPVFKQAESIFREKKFSVTYNENLSPAARHSSPEISLTLTVERERRTSVTTLRASVTADSDAATFILASDGHSGDVLAQPKIAAITQESVWGFVELLGSKVP